MNDDCNMNTLAQSLKDNITDSMKVQMRSKIQQKLVQNELRLQVSKNIYAGSDMLDNIANAYMQPLVATEPLHQTEGFYGKDIDVFNRVDGQGADERNIVIMDGNKLQKYNIKTKEATDIYCCENVQYLKTRSKFLLTSSNKHLVYVDDDMVALFDLSTFELQKKIETKDFDENGMIMRILLFAQDRRLLVQSKVHLTKLNLAKGD